MPPATTATIRSGSRHMLWAATAVLTATVATISLALTMPAIERQLARWQILPKQQQLTELSLVTTHPKTSGANQSQTVQFIVHNRTAKPAVYSYVITETSPAGNRLARLGSGSVSTTANATQTVSKTIVPADLGKRVYISVQLNTGLRVGYWVER